jgi:hypothetical protein
VEAGNIPLCKDACLACVGPEPAEPTSPDPQDRQRVYNHRWSLEGSAPVYSSINEVIAALGLWWWEILSQFFFLWASSKGAVWVWGPRSWHLHPPVCN